MSMEDAHPEPEVLYADDDAAMREVVAAVLRSGGLPSRMVTNGAEALAAVRERLPALVILDYRMGRPDGLQVCRTLKSDPRTEHIPVLILTAKGATEARLAGFHAGADDYLAKPFDSRELLARVRALLRLSRQGLDRNPTSTLPGGEAIQRDYARRRESDQPLALCYFDLDDFKPFGDRFGFSAGDAVIREAAEAITSVAAPDDFVGHIGGDDFLLMCPPDRARATVEAAQRRFTESLARHLPPEVAAAGSYRGTDRAGRERDIRVTRLAAAILLIEPGDRRTLGEMGEAIARAKIEAKADPGGLVERRLEASTIVEERGGEVAGQAPPRRGGSPSDSNGSRSSRNS